MLPPSNLSDRAMIRWLRDPDLEMLALLSLPFIGCGVVATILAAFVWAVVAAIRWGLS